MVQHSAAAVLEPLTPQEVADIAARASCDPKTMRSWLRNGNVRPSLCARIVASLRSRKMLDRAHSQRLAYAADATPARLDGQRVA